MKDIILIDGSKLNMYLRSNYDIDSCISIIDAIFSVANESGAFVEKDAIMVKMISDYQADKERRYAEQEAELRAAGIDPDNMPDFEFNPPTGNPNTSPPKKKRKKNKKTHRR